MANLGSLLVSLGVDAGPFQSGMSRAASQADKSSNLIKRSFGGMKDFVKRSFANMGDEILGEFGVRGIDQVIAGIKGVASATVGAAGDFEAGMNRFAAVAGGGLADAGMELSQFGDLFLEMGQKTQYSAAEAEEAAINLAKGGIDPATIAAGGLEQALGLAAAGELELAESADIMAKQLGVWVDKSADATTKTQFLASTADLMAQAANASTVGVDDLALGLANAGGSAKVAGLTFQETVTTMAQLAPGFSSAADAGTSFKAFIAGLTPETKKQVSAMKDLNLITETGQSLFYDSAGAFIGMEKASELLYQSTKNLSQEQRSLALQAIFGQDAIRAAAIIAEKGGAAYSQMADDMAAAGSATEQAAKRQKGWNFAIEQIQGSIETLSIVLGTALLPMLTNLAENVLLPAVNGFLEFSRVVLESASPMETLVTKINEIIPGFRGFVTVISTLVGFLSDNFVPIMTTAGAILLTMAVTQLPVLITAIIGATTAWTGYGVAMGILAAGPFVLIGAAVFGITKALQNFHEIYDTGVQKLLESREWWNQSTEALTRFKDAGLESNAAISPLAASLEDLRATQEGELESLTKRMAAGQVSSEQYAIEMAAINARAEAIQGATDDLNYATAAQEANNWVMENSARLVPPYVTAMQGAGNALRIVQDQVGLTADEMAELEKKMEETAQKIPESFQEMTNGVLSFYGDLEKTVETREAAIQEIYKKYGGQKAAERSQAGALELAEVQKSYQDQLNAAIVSHATELAEQRRHLGEMLLMRAEQFASDPSNNIAAEQAAEMSRRIREEYGLVESKSSEVFGSMTGHIDAWAANVNRNANTTIADLKLAEDQAIILRQAEDRLTGEFLAKFQHDFEEGRLSAEQLAVKISQIPTLVRTTIESNFQSQLEMIRSVGDAMSRLPTSKLIRIEAIVDDQVRRRSPAPIEQVMAAVNDFAARSHTLRIGADINDQLVSHSPAPIVRTITDLHAMASKPVTVRILSPQAIAVKQHILTLQAELRKLTKVQHLPVTAPAVIIIKDQISQLQKQFNQLTKPKTIPVKVTEVKTPKVPKTAAGGRTKTKPPAVGTTKTPRGASVKTPRAKTGGGGSGSSDRDPLDIAGRIEQAIDALEKLNRFRSVSREAIASFAMAVRGVTTQLAAVSKGFSAEALEHTGAFAETAGKAVAVIGSGVDAFSKLEDYQRVPEANLRAFIADLAIAVAAFGRESRNLGTALDERATLFAETAGKVVGVIGSGVESLSKINDYVPPTQTALFRFIADLGLAVYVWGKQAESIEDSLTQTALDFAETAGKVVGVLGSGVAGFDALRGYEGVSRGSLYRFIADLGLTVYVFDKQAQSILESLTEEATQFAQIAGAAVGTIGGGIDAFSKLEDYQGVAFENLKRFVSDLGFAVWVFDREAQETMAQLENDVGKRFVEAAGGAVGVIASAVDAFDKLKDFQDVPRDRLRKLMDAIQLAVRIMGDMAASFERDGVTRTAEFAEAVGKIIAPIKTALDTFDGLKTYENVPPDRMRALAADMYEAYYYMAEIAKGATAEGIDAATVFSEALTKVFAAMKGGIEALGGLKTYEGVPPERFQAFLADMFTSLRMMDQIAQMGGTIQAQAQTASASMAAVAGAIKVGTDALDGLREYETVPSERIQAFLADIVTTYVAMEQAATQAGLVRGKAGEWESALGTAASAIRAGLDSINALDGLTASATVNAAVDVNGGNVGDKGLGGFTKLAVGTRSFEGGMALVGERGPELVAMPSNTRVHTTAQTKGILDDIAGRSAGPEKVENHVHLTIERVDDEELVEVLVQRVARKLEELSRK